MNEIIQIIFGKGYVLKQRLESGEAIQLTLNCSKHYGWLLTYDGKVPHISSISGAQEGTKILIQLLAPADWKMRYID